MSKPLVTNAANEGQVKSAAQKERALIEIKRNALAKLLAQREFRDFAWRYLSDCKVFAQTFDHSGSITSFNEGRRGVGLKLMKEIVSVSPEAFMQMMKENEEGETI
jgi:hypothetical protein